MKNSAGLLFLALIIISLVSSAVAHEGMIALFTDETVSDCDANLPPSQSVNLYLFYIRGNGPEFGNGCTFRLLSSSDGVELHAPFWSPSQGTVLSLGELESGISICIHAGETGWCETGQDAVLLGNIPIFNVSDFDTFTVTVVDDPRMHWNPGIFITLCDVSRSQHRVIGGTFVFNGSCNDPEDPLLGPVGTDDPSWGAIKSLYKD